MPQTLFDKIWDSHLVARRADGRDLIYIDRHVLHELHGPHAFEKLAKANRGVRRPDLTFSMQDHTIATKPGRDDTTNPEGAPFLRAMREGSAPQRHPRLRSRRSRAGHLARRRAGTRHGAAGRDSCRARQPCLHRRRPRRARLRGRHHRARARAGDPGAGDPAAEAHARKARRPARRSGRRQRRGAAHHRRDRGRRRPRPRRRVCRRGGAGDADREPADAVQSRNRNGRALRLHRPRRHDVFVDRGPPVGAAGAAVGDRARRVAVPHQR